MSSSVRRVLRAATGLVAFVPLLHPVLLSAQRRGAQPATAATGPEIPLSSYAALRYRYIGPEGNRVSAVVGVPGDPLVYYAGAASGGIWKSTDGGVRWRPIFEDYGVASIGSLAIAPSDPNVIWAGTGESCIRSHISLGWGIFKSTDAGRTWLKMGLDNTGRIGQVVIDPRNPDIVFAAAMGHAYGPQPERGVYRTMDGGKTWERVLFVNDSTGAIDIAMDPNNPRILFAAMWQLEIHTWGRESGGEGSGIYKSTDGGTTWRRLRGNGLPTRPIGKVSLAMTKANSNRIYALIETGDGVPTANGDQTESGELWRSDNGGDTWQVVSYDRQLGGRQHYYTHAFAQPDNPDEAHFLAGSYSRTLDGGVTTVDGFEAPGGDHHDMWIDPTNGNRMIVGHDGGISISSTRGRQWYRTELPIAQMYHVTTDNQIPYTVCGNMQDGPSTCGPSNTKTGGGGRGGGGGPIPRGEWFSVGGGESGFATPDPKNPNLIWSSASGSGAVGGIVVRYDRKSKQVHNVEVWPVSTGGHPAGDVKYRFVWDAPLTISPHDNNKVYTGSQHVHVTTNGGRSWQVISPDLTLNDKSKQRMSGGLTPDNIGVEYAGTLFSIAESPVTAGVLWTGSNDGLVHVSRDGGTTWTNVTKNIPGLIPWGTINHIEPSRYDAGTAYIAVDGHQANNRDPWAYKTTDYGQSWKLIVAGIPRSPLSFVNSIKEDPVRRGLLYLGTENALYVSFDDGEHWQSFQQNLPPAPVYSMVIQEHFNDLVVATYGRGFFIVDDITPLQQLTPAVAASDVHLFVPRAAYRFRQSESPRAMSDDPTVGQNPQYGASLHYWLKSPPAGDVTITIADAGGAVVRTLRGAKQTGINRIYWDLRGEPTKEARMRTSPLYAPEVRVGPDGTRPAQGVGRMAILVAPGRYTVKLSVAGREYSQPLEVRKDPDSGGDDREIATQIAMLQDLSVDVNSAVDMINSTEVVRSQLQALMNVLSGDRAVADVRAAADSLEKKFRMVEDSLVQLRLTGRGQDGVRWPAKLASKLLALGNNVGSSDYAPTAQAREAHIYLKDQLRIVKAAYEQIMRDLPAFNELLRRRNLQSIISM